MINFFFCDINNSDISDNGTCKIDPNTQLYDSNCRFYFNEQYKPDTSLASYHQLNSVMPQLTNLINRRNLFFFFKSGRALLSRWPGVYAQLWRTQQAQCHVW